MLVHLTVRSITLPLWIVEELVCFDCTLRTICESANCHCFVLSDRSHRAVESNACSPIATVCVVIRGLVMSRGGEIATSGLLIDIVLKL